MHVKDWVRTDDNVLMRASVWKVRSTVIERTTIRTVGHDVLVTFGT